MQAVLDFYGISRRPIFEKIWLSFLLNDIWPSFLLDQERSKEVKTTKYFLDLFVASF
jgi:hypothetical protein